MTESNPKAEAAALKAPMSTVPAPVLLEIGVAMLEGARKYGRHNFRVSDARASTYYDAAMRHLMAWWEGEDFDRDSHLSHVTKAIAGLVVLRDAMQTGQFMDDRPPAVSLQWLVAMNAVAAQVIEDTPNPKDAYTCRPCTPTRKKAPDDG